VTGSVAASRWRASALAGEPAFVLGNGPTLPADLSRLDGYFTVGVNRILWHYDPTVLIWLDADVWADIKGPARGCKAALAPSSDVRHGPGSIRPAKPGDDPRTDPSCYAAVGNSGVTAAIWAHALGCRPVYLLGMSASYLCGKTNSYGMNPRHGQGTAKHMRRALMQLLSAGWAYPILDQAGLQAILALLSPKRRTREWFHDQLAT